MGMRSAAGVAGSLLVGLLMLLVVGWHNLHPGRRPWWA